MSDCFRHGWIHNPHGAACPKCAEKKPSQAEKVVVVMTPSVEIREMKKPSRVVSALKSLMPWRKNEV